MAGTAGLDRPGERDVVDLLPSSRDDALISWVESAGEDEIVVTVGEDRTRRRVRLDVGEVIQVLWRGPEELRVLPTELVSVDLGPRPVWRLRPIGPAARGQRRAAVRAPLPVAVRMTAGSETWDGRTVDLSEGGLRALFGPDEDLPKASPAGSVPTGPAPAGDEALPAAETATEAVEPPDPSTPDPLGVGEVVSLVLWVGDVELPCRAEVIRRIRRPDRRPELSLRFVGLHEKSQDVIRRYVFEGLRTLRARGML